MLPHYNTQKYPVILVRRESNISGIIFVFKKLIILKVALTGLFQGNISTNKINNIINVFEKCRSKLAAVKTSNDSNIKSLKSGVIQ